MYQYLKISLGVIVAATLLVACGESAPPVDPQVAARAQIEAQAAQSLKLYEDLRSSGKLDLAADIGAGLVAKYPGSAAARQVQASLAEVSAAAAQKLESRRLANLWTYSAVPEGKGKQYSAYVYTKGGPTSEGPQRARLVLRQHPNWGQSVYLLRDQEGFGCGKPCSVQVRLDAAAAQRMQATIPPTGEPALFIDDDVGFIAKLAKAKNVEIEVEWKGQGKRALEFEVAGLDLGRLPKPPAKK